jgi:hypothetical protein
MPDLKTTAPFHSNQTARANSPGRFVETILELADRTQNLRERRHRPKNIAACIAS